MTIKYLRSTGLLVICLIAASSMAWHKDKPPGAQNMPEVSEAELQRQQRMQAVQGEVGVVPPKTEDNATVEGADSADRAGKAIADNSGGEDRAARVIGAASQELEGPKSHNPWQTPSIILLILGMLYYALRRWADRTIPPMARS